MNLQVIAIRHPPVLNPHGLCYGHREMEVDSSQVATHLRDLQNSIWPFLLKRSVFFSSPSLRCRVLADQICPTVYCLDHRIRELNFGFWEGCPWDKISRSMLDEWAKDIFNFAPPLGESFQALVDRMKSFLWDHRLLGSILIVTHNGPLKALQYIESSDKNAPYKNFSFASCYEFNFAF